MARVKTTDRGDEPAKKLQPKHFFRRRTRNSKDTPAESPPKQKGVTIWEGATAVAQLKKTQVVEGKGKGKKQLASSSSSFDSLPSVGMGEEVLKPSSTENPSPTLLLGGKVPLDASGASLAESMHQAKENVASQPQQISQDINLTESEDPIDSVEDALRATEAILGLSRTIIDTSNLPPLNIQPHSFDINLHAPSNTPVTSPVSVLDTNIVQEEIVADILMSPQVLQHVATSVVVERNEDIVGGDQAVGEGVQHTVW